jgi:hypothetical protein
MKTIDNPDVVEMFRSRLERELVETVLLIDETRESRAPVELDQQSAWEVMQSQAMAQHITRRRQHRKRAIEQAWPAYGAESLDSAPNAANRSPFDGWTWTPPSTPACVVRADHADHLGAPLCEENQCRDE